MTHSPDAAVVVDPFFEAVTRRHRDVDVVVLPASAAAEAEPAHDEQLAHLMLDLATLARDLWTRATGPEVEPVARFSYGDGPGTLRAEARCRAERSDGEKVIDRIRDELLARGGWDIIRPSGGTPRLRARRGSVDIVTSYVVRTGVVLFRVSGPSVSVGVDRARELTRNGGR